MKKILKYVILLLCLFLVSCSPRAEEPPEKKDEGVLDEGPTTVPDVPGVPDEPVTEDPVPDEPDPTKTEISMITGLPCTPELYSSRPIAVMINNLKDSYPQMSVSGADLIYECNAEGGITRLMAVYSDWSDISEIGSVRSARPYFISLAEGHDAIFVHAGGSDAAYEKIKTDRVNNIDGVNMYNIPSSTFYRDPDRRKNNGYEHSLMTASDRLLTALDTLKYRREYPSNFESGLKFDAEARLSGGECVKEIKLKHSYYITVTFTYDEENGKYLKSSFDEPNVDGVNGEKLYFDNVLVLFVRERVLDEAGRLDVSVVGEGRGYYLTSSECYDITWSKDDDMSPIRYYIDGEELTLRPGKTHITFFNKNNTDAIVKK